MKQNFPEGSPPFPISNTSSIAPGAHFVYSFEISAPQVVKYLPFNDLDVANTDQGNSITLIIDGGIRKFTIPAGTIRHFDKGTLAAFSSIDVLNNGSGTIAATAIEIIAQLAPIDTESVIQGAAPLIDRLFGVKK